MKIAITSMYLPTGSKIGVGYVVHALGNELTDRGHQVTIFSQTGAPADARYQVVVVPSGKRFRSFGFAWNLRRYDFSKFDVLNAHGDDWFLWGCRRPRHVHTFHGSLIAETLHVSGVKERLRMAALALAEIGACFLADVRVAVSENTRRYVPFVDQVIPNGVDLSQFHPAEHKSAAPSVLFVGTMRGRNRGAMLLEAFQREIKPRVPAAELWAVCEEEVSGEGVRWFGRVTQEKLVELYRDAWVFCLPSSYEGFGVPYIEAMASGTAVVATPNPGAREILREGRCGLLAPEDQIGAEICKILSDHSLRTTLETKGRLRADDFGWDRVCAQYEAVYQKENSSIEASTFA